ncbi:hypothetical protein SAMN04487926_10591 [Paraburkholderia steynii]|uniref:Uncharacterized protein n=1 Tax=Paraburkholderia steynii TaxID=1245441 RepID=A0A7Z7B593_9BURK|nr:hypothetical protein SAMN04487926_10591 [Paraburkholderia steynii]
MHVAWASVPIVAFVVVQTTLFVRARSLLPLAPGLRDVHLWHPASRSTPPHPAHD